MPAPVAGIHVFGGGAWKQDVDGRDAPGHGAEHHGRSTTFAAAVALADRNKGDAHHV
jgi:hypothetical protein